MKSGKRHLTDGIELANQQKIRTLARKRGLQILRNLGGWHYQRSGNEKTKFKKNISREVENYSREVENYSREGFLAETLSKE